MEKEITKKTKIKQILSSNDNFEEPVASKVSSQIIGLSKPDRLRQVNQVFIVKLEQYFLKKVEQNPSYSLRAFSKRLGVDQSYLSKVLKGQKYFSETTIRKITPKLGLSPLEEKQLWGLNEKTVSGFQWLEEEKFQLISDWSNFAVLELIKTHSFIATPEFISTRLNIHIEEARCILKRLQNLGFISIREGKITLLLPNNSWTNNQFTTEARIKLQNKLIDKSKEALNEIPQADRDHGSLTVAIDRKRLPEFKEKLAQMRKELDQYFQTGNSFDEVYQLTVSFFPLTKI